MMSHTWQPPTDPIASGGSWHSAVYHIEGRLLRGLRLAELIRPRREAPCHGTEPAATELPTTSRRRAGAVGSQRALVQKGP